MASGFRERLILSAGYSEVAPSSQEEEELLSQLVNACLGSSEVENEELLQDVMALARAQGQCRESGVATPNIRAVSSNVMQAVKDLKRQVVCQLSPPSPREVYQAWDARACDCDIVLVGDCNAATLNMQWPRHAWHPGTVPCLIEVD